MKRRNFIVVIAIAVFFIFGGMFWLCISPTSPAPELSLPSPSPSAQTTQAVQTTSAVPVLKDDGAEISLKTMSRDKATWIYAHRSQRDVYYDWEQPVDFYGKVIDQDNRPVAGATADMIWTTLGVPGGSLEKKVTSDQNGLFSLTGQRGKGLEIQVKKEGYYTVEGSKGGVDFEYANPSSPYWYEPEINDPVVFHLRKMREGAKLFTKSFNVPLPNSRPEARVNLMEGFIKPDGPLVIRTDKSQFIPGAQPFPWTISFSMTEGGLIETDDQFPFQAPDSGYVSSVTIAMTNLDRSIWRGNVTKTYYFYLPSTNTYGRFTVDTAATVLFVSLNYVYNPTPGDRNLEPSRQ